MWLIDIVCGVLVLSGIVMAVYAAVMLKYNQPKLSLRRKEQVRMAVLIPARDESRVITGILESLGKQTLKPEKQDIYVIVEDASDPTVEICCKFGVNIVVRKPPIKQCKGAAMDEAVKQILARGEHYDLYFVFDADNTLTATYLEKMVKIYKQGYAMATGYRMPKNGNQNVIAAASALTFTMINVLGNQSRIRHHGNIIFSGTGCFVAGEIVEKWGGWPFQSLTEDYEMSLYATLEGLSTYYNAEAVFYDEQPTKYRQTVLQRTRWIRGYFDARKLYIAKIRQKMHQKPRAHNYGSLVRESIGVTPIILIVVGLVLELVNSVVRLFLTQNTVYGIIIIAGVLILVYVILAIVTDFMLLREKTRFKLSLKVKTILYNPIYLLGYIPCAILAILGRKRIKWQKIEHGDT